MADVELPRGQIGEIIVSGWHVNTYQVTYHPSSHITFHYCVLQVDSKRLIRDIKGELWLRIEDAGYMDEEGRLWLVGRVKWRVEREGKTYWSIVVEQKVSHTHSLYSLYIPICVSMSYVRLNVIV